MKGLKFSHGGSNGVVCRPGSLFLLRPVASGGFAGAPLGLLSAPGPALLGRLLGPGGPGLLSRGVPPPGPGVPCLPDLFDHLFRPGAPVADGLRPPDLVRPHPRPGARRVGPDRAVGRFCPGPPSRCPRGDLPGPLGMDSGGHLGPGAGGVFWRALDRLRLGGPQAFGPGPIDQLVPRPDRGAGSLPGELGALPGVSNLELAVGMGFFLGAWSRADPEESVLL